MHFSKHNSKVYLDTKSRVGQRQGAKYTYHAGGVAFENFTPSGAADQYTQGCLLPCFVYTTRAYLDRQVTLPKISLRGMASELQAAGRGMMGGPS